MNSYPSPELQEECENLDRGDIQQEASMSERLEIAYLNFWVHTSDCKIYPFGLVVTFNVVMT